MSYEFASGLQAAVWSRLSADPALLDLVGGRIHDAPSAGLTEDAPEHVTLGEESVRPWDTKTSRGAIHDFTVTVHSARDGFDLAKRIAGAVCVALEATPLALELGRVVTLRFVQARAERGAAPEKRRIALRFRAVVDQE